MSYYYLLTCNRQYILSISILSDRCPCRLELEVILSSDAVYNEDKVGAVITPNVDYEDVGQMRDDPIF